MYTISHSKGDDELFEKKLSKEEKKALAKAKRDAKKKMKKSSSKGSKLDLTKEGDDEEKKDGGDEQTTKSLAKMSLSESGIDPNSEEGKREAALEELSQQNIVVTYEQKKGNLHANTRDINVDGVSVAFHGKLLMEETSVVINYGNRYGFIGPNGSGKVRGIWFYMYVFAYCFAYSYLYPPVSYQLHL